MTARYEFSPLDNAGIRRLSGKHWTLCLGAGINGPLMPNWERLAHTLTNSVCGSKLTDTQFHKVWMDSSWSLEAWIQNALNWQIAHGSSVKDFTRALQDELYRNIDSQQKSD